MLVSFSVKRSSASGEHWRYRRPYYRLLEHDPSRRPRVGGEARAAASRPRTRCCGTRSSGAGRASRPPAPRLWAVISTRTSSGRRLGVLDEDVEVATLRRRSPCRAARTPGRDRAPPPVLLEQLRVGELGVRVLVELLHVRVRGRGVEVEPVLLDVLAVVALGVRQAEEALLEDRVLPVPERQGEADRAGAGRRSRGSRPRSSGRRGSARGRAESSPRPSRSRCSPRAPSPRRARRDTGPSGSSGRTRRSFSASRRPSAVSAAGFTAPALGSCQPSRPAVSRSASFGPHVPGAYG